MHVQMTYLVITEQHSDKKNPLRTSSPLLSPCSSCCIRIRKGPLLPGCGSSLPLSEGYIAVSTHTHTAETYQSVLLHFVQCIPSYPPSQYLRHSCAFFLPAKSFLQDLHVYLAGIRLMQVVLLLQAPLFYRQLKPELQLISLTTPFNLKRKRVW
jgi:hypothetical protein